MKNFIFNFIVAISLVLTTESLTSTSIPWPKKPINTKIQITNPDQALSELIKGNKKFTKNWGGKRKNVAIKQSPFAIVLTCSDSRVSPEILFNQFDLGDLFVIRNAGNVLDNIAIGSIEYGVEHLNALLIIILGHERCGAVTATIDAIKENKFPTTGYIKNIIDIISPAVNAVILRNNNILTDYSDQNFTGSALQQQLNDQIVTDSIKANVKLTASLLYQKSEIVRKAVDENKIKIVGAYYDLDDGNIQIIS